MIRNEDVAEATINTLRLRAITVELRIMKSTRLINQATTTISNIYSLDNCVHISNFYSNLIQLLFQPYPTIFNFYSSLIQLYLIFIPILSNYIQFLLQLYSTISHFYSNLIQLLFQPYSIIFNFLLQPYPTISNFYSNSFNYIQLLLQPNPNHVHISNFYFHLIQLYPTFIPILSNYIPILLQSQPTISNFYSCKPTCFSIENNNATTLFVACLPLH